MQPRTVTRAGLEHELARYGLRVRGGWMPRAGDALPALPDGRPVAVVWMIGQAGSECWDAFTASPMYVDGQANPMDRWCKSIGNELAHRLGGAAWFPSDGPPYRPFSQWAARAEALRASPVKLLIHPQYGLWHAYRFALALPGLAHDDAAGVAPSDAAGASPDAAPAATDLCARCDGQPCLRACPVHAFDENGYDVPRCAAHLHGPHGTACMTTGCLARHACPAGTQFRYAPAHAAFHMAAFARNH